jgi:extracellular factor (EF) 3-hydroxypalmitic acid methyl ester biosynthesis protein
MVEFKRICRDHPLHKLIQEDPYSRRAYEKPRGYSGDAVMLDYIYKPSQPEASLVGAAVHQATIGLPNAKSILWRRNYLAARICDVIKTCREGRCLSVASGHMRELEIVRTTTTHRDLEFWALDQDQDSIEECLRSYPDFKIKPINRSISFLFKGKLAGERYDMVYSAGLLDYLPDKTAEALLRKLYECLSEGGLLTVGNFTADSHGRGFMEAFMDWSLVYRNEEDIIRIAGKAIPAAKYRMFRDDPGNVIYIEITK